MSHTHWNFPKYISWEQERDIFRFVYQWNTNRIVGIVMMNLPSISPEGIEGEIKYRKDIYKDFKRAFPFVKQPGVAIDKALHSILWAVRYAIQEGTFVQELEGDP